MCAQTHLAKPATCRTSTRPDLLMLIGMQVKAVSVEEDEIGGADSDEKTNANWILQNI